jgi:hypothetical protein
MDRIIDEHLRHGRPVADRVFHQGPGCAANGADDETLGLEGDRAA